MPELDDDNLDDNNTNTGAETPAAKTLRKQNSKLAADLKAAEERITALMQKTKTADLAVLLKDKFKVDEKYQSKAARFIARDVEDPTEESVLAWLKEDGDMFGWSEDSLGDGQASTDRAEQARRISNITNSAPPAQAGVPTPDQMAGMSFADLIARGVINSD